MLIDLEAIRTCLDIKLPPNWVLWESTVFFLQTKMYNVITLISCD